MTRNCPLVLDVSERPCLITAVKHFMQSVFRGLPSEWAAKELKKCSGRLRKSVKICPEKWETIISKKGI